MKTTFDNWLRALAADLKGGTGLGGEDIPAAVRGEKWRLLVRLEGDWTASTLTGAVRIQPDAASPLVTITCAAPIYDAGADLTTWITSLAAGTGANATGNAALPADGDADGVTALPAAYHLTTAGDTQLLFGFAFVLVGNV